MKTQNPKFLISLICFLAFSYNVVANDTIRLNVTLTTASDFGFYICTGAGKQFTVNWGDDTKIDTVTFVPPTYPPPFQGVPHRYANKGNYAVTIAGTTPDCLFSLFLCGGNDSYHFTYLDVSKSTSLQNLSCNWHVLNTLNVSNNKRLGVLGCAGNHLTEIDLRGLDLDPDTFMGRDQNVAISFYENEIGEYIHSILLNNPTFGNSAISFWDNILKSTDNSVSSTSFRVQTGKPGLELSGTMNFTYSNVEVKTQEKIDLKVYPNPVSDILFIESENFNTIKLYDMLGREMLCKNGNDKTEINISHLPNGIYIVAVFSEGKLMGNSKIIKQ